MIFVLALLGVGLAYAAWKYRPGRPLLLGFAALNLIGLAVMAVEEPPYAYTLKPHTSAPGID